MTLEGKRWTPEGFGTASLVSSSATTRHPNEWPTKITGAPSAAARRAASTTNWTFAPIWEGKFPAHLPLAIVWVAGKILSSKASRQREAPALIVGVVLNGNRHREARDTPSPTW